MIQIPRIACHEPERLCHDIVAPRYVECLRDRRAMPLSARETSLVVKTALRKVVKIRHEQTKA